MIRIKRICQCGRETSPLDKKLCQKCIERLTGL